MRTFFLPLLVLALTLHLGTASAAQAEDLDKQRRAAQKERQARKNERSKALNDAIKAFRAYVHELNGDFRARAKALDAEYELRRVDLKAERDVRAAAAQAEYEKKIVGLFTRPNVTFDQRTIEQLQAEGRVFADELFALERQGAEALHAARVENELEKNEIWTERDALAMERAAALGLTKTYEPILATPIGGELNDQEKRWNESEIKEVARLMERKRKMLGEYQNGAELRAWQLANMNEDFRLAWKEKEELHALDAEHAFYSTLFMQAAQGGRVDQQKLVAKIAEIGEKKKLVNIAYRQERDKERILRREEKRAIMDK